MDQQQQPCIKHKRKQCPQKSDVVHWITEVHFQKLETNDETICSVFVYKLMLHNTHTPSIASHRWNERLQIVQV